MLNSSPKSFFRYLHTELLLYLYFLLTKILFIFTIRMILRIGIKNKLNRSLLTACLKLL